MINTKYHSKAVSAIPGYMNLSGIIYKLYGS